MYRSVRNLIPNRTGDINTVINKYLMVLISYPKIGCLVHGTQVAQLTQNVPSSAPQKICTCCKNFALILLFCRSRAMEQNGPKSTAKPSAAEAER